MVRCTPIDDLLDGSKLELTPARALLLNKPEANNLVVVAGEGEGPTGRNQGEFQHNSQKKYTELH
jgi:hypothetical protein